MKSWIKALMAAGLMLGGGARAGEAPDWRFELTPYLWLAALEGDAAIGGRHVDFNRSASDLLDNLEIGGSLLGVAQYKRAVFGGQLDLFNLRTDAMKVDGHSLEGELDSDLGIFQLVAGWQFDGWMEGQAFTVAAGVRHLRWANELAGAGGGTERRTFNLTDPVVIVWPTLPLLKKKIDGLALNPVFALGGGGDSELIFEMFPQIRYRVNDRLQVRFGYRTIGVRVEKDSGRRNEVDIRLAGFLFGLGGTF
ncbi:MAG: hypothetical protein GX548_04285 [Lentisphaerae bacterium]|nr:hypothetical protein [Lentisphaerota bacterium]